MKLIPKLSPLGELKFIFLTALTARATRMTVINLETAVTLINCSFNGVVYD